MTKTLNTKKGFTLTELIIVIAIIGILAAVLVPTFSGYISKARESKVEQEAKSISTIYEAWLLEPDVVEDGFADEEEAATAFLGYYTGLGNAALDEGTFSIIGVDANGVPTGFTYTKSGYVATYTNGGPLVVDPEVTP